MAQTEQIEKMGDDRVPLIARVLCGEETEQGRLFILFPLPWKRRRINAKTAIANDKAVCATLCHTY